VFKIGIQDTKHAHDGPVLELNQVSAAYQELGKLYYAVKNISFQVQKAEHIAFIGPNGAGKSTILKLIAGIIKPASGKILMFGSDPLKHNCVAYVPQRSQVDWSFPVTVEDVVMMGRARHIGFFKRPQKRDREIVKQSLERVGAIDLAKKQIGELSGGQQQRVFIARSLALETELLLLDEPLAALDIPTQEAICNILHDLRKDGVTVLMATHDLGSAAEHFDRIILINKEIIAIGHPKEVLSPENLLAAYGGKVAVNYA